MVGKIVFQGAKQLSQTQYPYKFHLKMKYSKKSVKCKKVKQQNILVWAKCVHCSTIIDSTKKKSETPFPLHYAYEKQKH